MLQYLDKLQKEDMENLIKKHEVQRSLMKDVAKANEVYKAIYHYHHSPSHIKADSRVVKKHQRSAISPATFPVSPAMIRR